MGKKHDPDKPKHSFHSDDAATEVLKTAVDVIRDKTVFLNRLIADYGPAMILTFSEEQAKCAAKSIDRLRHQLRRINPPLVSGFDAAAAHAAIRLDFDARRAAKNGHIKMKPTEPITEPKP